jgi:hypothetical protein
MRHVCSQLRWAKEIITVTEVASDLVRIPQKFFVDHSERDLPTPTVVKETKSHFFIKRDDPAWAELVDDARHYADPRATDCEHWLRMAAHRILIAMGEVSTYKSGVYKHNTY